MEIIVVLNNIRSVYNVGSVFRTCDAARSADSTNSLQAGSGRAGVSKIFLIGVTPTPLDRFGKFRADFLKVALGAEKTVTWEYFKNFGAVYRKLRKEGYKVLAVEQDKRSIPYYKWKPFDFAQGENQRVALIFGEETKGLPKSVLDKCDKILEIPMRGKKESLNVAVAAGIVLFRMVLP